MSHRIYSLVTDGLRDSEVFKPSEATLLSTVLPILSCLSLPFPLLSPHSPTGEQGIRESAISFLPPAAALQNFDFYFCVFMWVHICVLLFGG